MAPPKLTIEEALKRREIYHRYLSEGYHSIVAPDNKSKGSAATATVKELGLAESKAAATIRSLELVLEHNGLPPLDHGLYRRHAAQSYSFKDESGVTKHTIIKPVYRIVQSGGASKQRIRVVAIGDAHDAPDIPKDRFEAIGKYIAEVKPDMVIQIGDFLSFDSLCRYDPNDTIRGKHKPTFKEDMRSFKLALDAFKSGLGNYKVERHVTLGNHEDRAWSFMNRTPEIADMLSDTIYTALSDAGWTYSPFGFLHFVGGVAFTHSPLNGMGKPYGGMYSHNQIARDSLSDLVYGHTHKRVEVTFPKMNEQKLTVINLGCALPDQHMEPYARHALTGWSYGIYDMIIAGGQIQDTNWIPMPVVQEVYGKK